jgi:hypothetical protein
LFRGLLTNLHAHEDCLIEIYCRKI